MVATSVTDKKRAERKKHILDLMDAVHMDYGLLETPVRQLSGGEQRRLSLLRAIAVEPDYLGLFVIGFFEKLFLKLLQFFVNAISGFLLSTTDHICDVLLELRLVG